jgi:hypothetical protein
MRNLVVTGSALAVGALSVLVAVSHPHAHPQEHPPLQTQSPPTPDPDAPPPAGDPPPVEPATAAGAPAASRPVVASPPLGLTVSDGSGLALAELRADVVVEAPLAFTEIRLAFDNTENRVREGTFKITLPQGASLGRFAMKIGDTWQEGEVVEKAHARRAYEDFLHRKQDPALMERGAGNEFTARVFPIPAHGRKELVVSYAEELVGDRPYTLPLRGLPELGLLDVSVGGGEGEAPQRLYREHVVPAVDFVAKRASARGAIRSGNLAVATIRPVGEALPDPIRSAVVLVDTSASRALGLEDEMRTVRAILNGLGEGGLQGPTVSVAAFDQDVTPIFHGDAKSFGDIEIQRVLSRRALGASNFERALGWARDEAKRTGASRVVVVSDGVATAGNTDGAALATVARSLGDGGAQRLDFVAVGGLRDDALAHALVTAGLPHDGVVAVASDGAAVVDRRLEAETRSNLAVAVEGATWSYPAKLDGVQPGDDVLVYAELPEGAPLRIRLGDRAPIALATKPADHALLERGWARAKIASLEDEEREHGKSPELERRIVDLSTSHRVLSEYTALLVLETEADYARFHIDRSGLPDLLTVADGRLVLGKRGGFVHGGPLAPAATVAIPPGTFAKGASEDRKAEAPPAAPPSGIMPLSAQNIQTGTMAPEPSPPPPADEMSAAVAAAPRRMAPSMDDLAGAAGGAGGLGLVGHGAARARGEEGSMGNPSTAPMASAAPMAAPVEAPRAMAMARADRPSPVQAPEEPRIDPYTGKFKAVKTHLAAHDAAGAYALAGAWQASEPGDLLALTALGESAEAIGDANTAARAYGSIIDLFPARADLRRFAGERLEHVGGAGALDLATDTFDKARADRPDHPASHRLAAFARLRKGDYAGAFDVMLAGLARRYPEGRFPGVDRILREDLGLIAAAWMKAEPARSSDILARLRSAGGTLEGRPSLRFVLNWETDSNDVDFHIRDAHGGHAYYASKSLPSGGELYADVTTGYGPECFVIREPRTGRAGPYTLSAHYYSRGPMGYGMGKLEVIDHDGRGGIKIEERPFVVMQDHAFVDLGSAQ